MSLPYAREKQVALVAVRRACALTSSVFNKLVKNETLTKGDKSPVTVGDYSAQAVVNTILGHAFPADPIVGEEDAAGLRQEGADELRNRVVALANEALTAGLAAGESAEWGLGPGQARTSEQILDAIDHGNDQGGRVGRRWTLDPIDGTKGFLRGGQYAVCLALIVDGEVVLGVLGCPNLPVKATEPDGPRGCVFIAVKRQGAEQTTLSGDHAVSLTIPPVIPGELNILESVESGHANLAFNDRLSQLLNITRAPTQMDSQAKYGCLVRGDGGVYLRMPTGTGYQEKIWDHASGTLLVQESGGVITDSRGEPLDFGLGRTLGENYGIIAAGKDVHAQVLAAVQRALVVKGNTQNDLFNTTDKNCTDYLWIELVFPYHGFMIVITYRDRIRIDVFSLVMTTIVFVGIIFGVIYAARSISTHVQSTKTSLENKGITISRAGISVKTESRFDRERYVDATQRGFVKVLNTATVGPESRKQALLVESSSAHANAIGGGKGDGDDNHLSVHGMRAMLGATMRRSHSGSSGRQ